MYEYDHSKIPELVLEGTHDVGFDSVSLSEESEMVFLQMETIRTELT